MKVVQVNVDYTEEVNSSNKKLSNMKFKIYLLQ